jgi:stress response protein YsnF
MPLHLSIVVDVFTHEAQAKHALEALRQAGFGYDQIGIAMQGHEGIDLQSDLQNLGVSHEQASYYAQEVKAGHTVVSVRPDGREQEAHEIMRRCGAFTDADSAASQTSTIDKQRAVWDQAVASHQAYLAEQLASNTQEDFHRPRSLKPREERLPVTTHRVQAEEAELRPAMVTEQKPIVTPVAQNTVVMQKKPSVAPVVQNDQMREQLPLAEEEHRETTPIDDGETLRRLRNHAHGSVEVLPPQTPPEKHRNRALVKKGVLLGGVLLGLSTGVLVALLRREQIRQLVKTGKSRYKQISKS